MTRKFILISVILIFVISPTSAWVLVSSQYESSPQSKLPDQEVKPATKNELLEAITTKSKVEHIHQNDDGIRILDIVSYERLDTWWYILKVKSASFGKENPVSPMLVSKYYNGPDSIRIVTNIGEPLPYYDISESSGIPYDVIDKYNVAINESQPELGD